MTYFEGKTQFMSQLLEETFVCPLTPIGPGGSRRASVGQHRQEQLPGARSTSLHCTGTDWVTGYGNVRININIWDHRAALVRSHITSQYTQSSVDTQELNAGLTIAVKYKSVFSQFKLKVSCHSVTLSRCCGVEDGSEAP